MVHPTAGGTGFPLTQDVKWPSFQRKSRGKKEVHQWKREVSIDPIVAQGCVHLVVLRSGGVPNRDASQWICRGRFSQTKS